MRVGVISYREQPLSRTPRATRASVHPAALVIGVTALALLGRIPAAADGSPYEPAAVVATVGPRAITAGELVEEALRASGPATGEPARAAQALDALVREAALAAAARAAGFADHPEVRRSIDRLLGARLRAERLEPRLAAVTVEEAEVEIWYREHEAELRQPRRIRGAVVRVESSPKDPPERREARRAAAAAALEEARALPEGTPAFGGVAARVSDDAATRYRGGETGWLAEGAVGERWPQPVVAALFALDEPGAFGPLVEAPDGFWLVRLVDTRPAAPRPLAEVRDAIRQRLLAARYAAVEEAFFADVERQAGATRAAAALDGVIAEIARRTGSGASPPPAPPSGN
jgi:peptidylprolyl isomerase